MGQDKARPACCPNRELVAVLAQRNARIFCGGRVTCWTGSWMQRGATDWLAWMRARSTLPHMALSLEASETLA